MLLLLVPLLSTLNCVFTGRKNSEGTNDVWKSPNPLGPAIATTSSFTSLGLLLASEKGTPSRGSRLGFLARFEGVIFFPSSSVDALRLVGVDGAEPGWPSSSFADSFLSL